MIGGGCKNTSPIFCIQKSSISTSSAPVIFVGYEDGMSPSQLEDELDAAGLKVMEVGDISPPTMEARVVFLRRKGTGHPLAKGGVVRWWYRWLGT